MATRTRAKSRAREAPAGVLDPLAYLEQDHQKVRDLFRQLEGTSDQAEQTRSDLFSELRQALNLHTELEETYLYPVLEEEADTHELAIEAGQEHHAAKMLLRELSLGSFIGSENTEKWMAKLKVLKDNIEHHINEEESKLFKKARAALDERQVEDIGRNMQEHLESQ